MKTLQQIDSAIFDLVRRNIERRGEQHPVVIIVFHEENAPWHIIDMSNILTGEQGKEFVSGMIEAIGQRLEVAFVVFVSEAWMVMDDKAVLNGEVAPSEHPNRVECVVVGFSVTGGERAVSVHEIVRREGRRPRLLRGELRIEEGGFTFDGRFFVDRPIKH